MKLVIDISKEDYERLKEYEKAPFNSLTSRVYEAIANGTPLPKGHGRLIDADALWKKWVFDAIGKQEIDDAPTIIEADRGRKRGIKNEDTSIIFWCYFLRRCILHILRSNFGRILFNKNL